MAPARCWCRGSRCPPHGRGPRASGRSVRHDIAEGFRWVVHHAAVRTLALTIFIFNVTFGAAWSVLVLYATERLGLGAVGFGLLTTVVAPSAACSAPRRTAGSPAGSASAT